MARWFALIACSALGACGGESAPSTEVVVVDAGASPTVIGATASSVMWTSAAGTRISGGSLASLPVTAQELAMASGAVAHAGEYVAFAAEGRISRVTLNAVPERIVVADPDALGGNQDAPPTVAWTVGPVVSWGVDGTTMTATLTRVDSVDHVRVTKRAIYVAADGATGRRLLRIDQATGDITPITASSTWAAMFPGGGTAGATYEGRIVDADDSGTLWLVEEMPSGRGIVVAEPVQGEASLVLPHVSRATGFFASAGSLYWQEGDELLTAPRAGGAASIVASLPGAAGAVADGYVYFVNGSAIERLPVE